MHKARLLSHATQLASELGYQIREEPLEGAGGGHCLIRGQKWLLLDLTQSREDQLRDVVDALRADPNLNLSDVPPELLGYLQPLSKAA